MGLKRVRKSTVMLDINRCTDRTWGLQNIKWNDGRRFTEYTFTPDFDQTLTTVIRESGGPGPDPVTGDMTPSHERYSVVDQVNARKGQVTTIKADRMDCWGWNGGWGEDLFDLDNDEVPVYEALAFGKKVIVPVRRYQYIMSTPDTAVNLIKGTWYDRQGKRHSSSELKLPSHIDVKSFCGTEGCTNPAHMVKYLRDIDDDDIESYVEKNSGPHHCWAWMGDFVERSGKKYPVYRRGSYALSPARYFVNKQKTMPVPVRDENTDTTVDILPGGRKLSRNEMVINHCPAGDDLCVAPHHHEIHIRNKGAGANLTDPQCKNGHDMLDENGNNVNWELDTRGHRRCKLCVKRSAERQKEVWAYAKNHTLEEVRKAWDEGMFK